MCQLSDLGSGFPLVQVQYCFWGTIFLDPKEASAILFMFKFAKKGENESTLLCCRNFKIHEQIFLNRSGPGQVTKQKPQ